MQYVSSLFPVNSAVSPRGKQEATSTTESNAYDLVRLHELGIINEEGVVAPGSAVRLELTDQSRANIQAFLTDIRSDGHQLIALLNAIHFHIQGKSLPARIVGEELKGLLGWDCVYRGLQGLVPDQKVEDCFSAECLDTLKAECSEPPKILTIRFILDKSFVNRQQHIANLFSYLDGYILKGSVAHIDDEHVHLSSFCYQSVWRGVCQQIHFTFIEKIHSHYLTTNEAVQVALDTTPHLLDNEKASQWCVDIALKRLAVSEASSKTGKVLVRHIRRGYDPLGQESAIVQEGLYALWLRCNGDYIEDEVRYIQNALILCQLAYQAGASRDIVPFLTQSCPAHLITTKSVWHAALSLIRDQHITYEELEHLLVVLGVVASTLETTVSRRSRLGKEKLVFATPDFCYQVPLWLEQASRSFLSSFSRLKDKDAFIYLLEAFVYKPKGSNLASYDLDEIKKHLNDSEAGRALTLLLSNLPDAQDLFRTCLKIAPTYELEHRLLAKTLATHELPPYSPKSPDATTWITYLMMHYSQVGKELLLQLEGHAKFKARYIGHSDIAATIVSQIENDPSIEATDVRKWLQRQSRNAIWAQLFAGRWAQVAATSHPDLITSLDRLVEVFESDDHPSAELTLLVLKRAMQDEALASRVLSKVEQSPDLLTKAPRQHLNSIVSTLSGPLAMRAMRATGQYKPEVVLSAARDLTSSDLVDHYLSLRKTTLPYKYEPETQIRVFIAIANAYPDKVTKQDTTYLQSLYNLLSHERQDALKMEVLKSGVHTTFKEQFACFFRTPKEQKPQAVQVVTAESLIKQGKLEEALKRLLADASAPKKLCMQCVNGILKREVTLSVFRLLAKHLADELPLWQEALRQAASSFTCNFDDVVAIVQTLGDSPVWNIVFSFAKFISVKKMTELANSKPLFEKILKTQRNLDGFIEFLISARSPIPHAWLQYVPDAHPQKLALGIRLSQLVKQDDAQEVFEGYFRFIIQVLPQLTNAHLTQLKAFGNAARAATTPVLFVQTLGESTHPVAHRLAVELFSSHPHAGVQQALWRSMHGVAMHEQSPRYVKIIDSYILQMPLETLLDLYEAMFQFAGFLPQNPIDPAILLKTEKICHPAYSKGYQRLFALAIESTDSLLLERALLVDLLLKMYYPTQCAHIRQLYQDIDRTVQRGILKLLQQHGWTPSICNYFIQYVIHYHGETAHSMLHRVTRRFYSETRAPHLTTIAPLHNDIPELRTFITSSLEFAAKAASVEEKRTLLNFALQLIRNLMEKGFMKAEDSALIEQLVCASCPQDPLFAEHTHLMTALLRKAVRKKLMPVDDPRLSRCITHLQLDLADILKERVEALKAMKEALLLATEETAAEVIKREQENLLIWQEGETDTCSDERQEVLDLMFSLCRKHRSIVTEYHEFIDIIEEVLHPNGAIAGLEFGNQSQRQVLSLQKQVFELHVHIYNTTTDDETALAVLHTIIEKFYIVCYHNLYKDLYDEFYDQARAILHLLATARLPVSTYVETVATFTSLIIAERGDDAKRLSLINEWLITVRKHRHDADYKPYLEAVLVRIREAQATNEFTDELFESYYACLTTPQKISTIDAFSKTVQLYATTSPTLFVSFCAIYKSLVADEQSDQVRQVTATCFDAMVSCLAKVTYKSDFARFEQDVFKVMEFFKTTVATAKETLQKFETILKKPMPQELHARLTSKWHEITSTRNPNYDK